MTNTEHAGERILGRLRTDGGTGVVTVLAPDEPALVALVSLIGPVILSGNATVVLASETHPLAALTFAEILATSDLPGGVVNILTGRRAELVPHIADHMPLWLGVLCCGSPFALFVGSIFAVRWLIRRK